MCVFLCLDACMHTICCMQCWGSQRRAWDLPKLAVVSHRCVCWKLNMDRAASTLNSRVTAPASGKCTLYGVCQGERGNYQILPLLLMESHTLLLSAGRMVCHVLDVSYGCVYNGQRTCVLL